jgi:hypothetical protein
LTEDELKINFERLTRFKYPPERLLRVYCDIIVKNVIEPKISKKRFQNLNFLETEKLASIIWNSSIDEKKADKSIHHSIINKDLEVFEIKKTLEDILCTNLPDEFCFDEIKKYSFFEEFKIQKTDFAENFSYEKLYEIIRNKNVFEFEKSNNNLYKAKLLIIAEGVTEELLLKKIGCIWHLDFEKYGIKIHGAGGKNQAVKEYNEMKDRLKIPILVLFDSDAEENAELIKKIIRKKDSVYRIKQGEFEDLLSDKLIVNSINNQFKMNLKIGLDEIAKNDIRRTTLLSELWRDKGLGDFKKAEFAKIILQNASSKEDFHAEVDEIINQIKKMLEI